MARGRKSGIFVLSENVLVYHQCYFKLFFKKDEKNWRKENDWPVGGNYMCTGIGKSRNQ